jgi:hypothetical protein
MRANAWADLGTPFALQKCSAAVPHLRSWRTFGTLGRQIKEKIMPEQQSNKPEKGKKMRGRGKGPKQNNQEHQGKQPQPRNDQEAPKG